MYFSQKCLFIITSHGEQKYDGGKEQALQSTNKRPVKYVFLKYFIFKAYKGSQT